MQRPLPFIYMGVITPDLLCGLTCALILSSPQTQQDTLIHFTSIDTLDSSYSRWFSPQAPCSKYSFSLQTKLLTQYVLNLAKYDQNYDIRDRARFIRQLIVPTEKSGALSKYAKKLFLALKPAPVLESPFKGTEAI